MYLWDSDPETNNKNTDNNSFSEALLKVIEECDDVSR